MHQTIRGFYQSSSSKFARMTQIVGSSSPNPTEQTFFNGALIATNAFAGSNSPQSDRAWSSPTWDVSTLMPGKDLNTGFGEEVSTAVTHGKTSPYDCLPWAAVIFSTRLQDTDGDGIPDKLEDVSGLSDPDGSVLPDFHAMGASSTNKDFFVEVGAMKAAAGTTYGSAAAPLSADVTQVISEDGARVARRTLKFARAWVICRCSQPSNRAPVDQVFSSYSSRSSSSSERFAPNSTARQTAERRSPQVQSDRR